MKRFLPYIIYTFLLTLASCDTVGDDERLIYVKPPQVQRSILIEDFTGQRCVNCPAATYTIGQLQEQYGHDAVIAVGIHSGPLGFAGNDTNVGLMTDLGNEYYNYWNVEYQPAGVIDRNGGVLNYTDWQTKVHSELQRTAPIALKVDAGYDDATHVITAAVEATGTDGDTEGQLQLWLVEDNVKAMQLRYNTVTDASSGQVTDRDYMHQHVLRDAMNGTWGQPFAVKEGEKASFSCNYAVTATDWVVKNLSVVAFVYNTQGVQQVAKTLILKSE